MTEIVHYPQGNSDIPIRLDDARDTVWLRQEQMSELLGCEPSVITKHLRDIFAEDELEADSVCANFEHTGDDGETCQVRHYNLDVIIPLGYRVNAVQGTRFRQWATKVLRDNLLRRLASRARFDGNAAELQQALALTIKAARSPTLTAEADSEVAEIVSRYTQTFSWLQRYDEGMLNEPNGQRGGSLPGEAEAASALQALKASLQERGEVTGLFARPCDDGLSAILGDLEHSVLGEPVYATVESKAAHLLYFMVKSHPFADGNKPSDAFLFVDFLHRNGRLLNARGQPVINNADLAALTLLVAESDPNQKETIIRLIMNMLALPECTAA
jgi:prophage maintenance system killer protein